MGTMFIGLMQHHALLHLHLQLNADKCLLLLGMMMQADITC